VWRTLLFSHNPASTDGGGVTHHCLGAGHGGSVGATGAASGLSTGALPSTARGKGARCERWFHPEAGCYPTARGNNADTSKINLAAVLGLQLAVRFGYGTPHAVGTPLRHGMSWPETPARLVV
jgi:hypothetical protein